MSSASLLIFHYILESTISFLFLCLKGSREDDLDLPPLSEAPIKMRYESGPEAEAYSHAPGDLGYLELEVKGVNLAMLMSSTTSLTELIEDEKVAPPLPMKIVVMDTTVTLKVWIQSNFTIQTVHWMELSI